jgi:hypothetical protein
VVAASNSCQHQKKGLTANSLKRITGTFLNQGQKNSQLLWQLEFNFTKKSNYSLTQPIGLSATKLSAFEFHFLSLTVIHFES